MKKQMKKTETSLFRYLLVSVVLLLVTFGMAMLFSILLKHLSFSDDLADVVADMVSGIIAAVAAGLVLFQLRENKQERARQNDIEEASFILQYNQAFIQDPNMAEVEKLLEDQAFYGHEGQIITEENRQKFVNYLVYLEGLAPLVLRGVLKLDHIDDLMAYRFFLAMNNPEVQEKELKRFARDYRGCFKLYRVWSDYRDRNGFEIHSKETALDKWQEFSTYAY